MLPMKRKGEWNNDFIKRARVEIETPQTSFPAYIIPTEIALHIFTFMPTGAFPSLNLVSKTWSKLVHHQSFTKIWDEIKAWDLNVKRLANELMKGAYPFGRSQCLGYENKKWKIIDAYRNHLDYYKSSGRSLEADILGPLGPTS
jgi:hypothetical protein